MKKSAFALFLIAAVFASASALAATVYVKSAKAKIMKSPRFDAPLVSEVERGQALSLVEKGDRWIKVKHADKEGWVSELLVSEEPPKGRQSVLETGEDDLAGKARRRASAIATAGASRGLRAEGMKDMGEGDQKGDWAALAKVDSFLVDPDIARKFIADGMAGTKGGAR